jgi:outer membrane protein assembly factor BamC
MQFVRTLFRVMALTCLVVMVTACSTADSLLPDRRPDYRQSKVLSPLEVPPDLTASTIDDTLVVPELNPTSSASFSDYASERPGGSQIAKSEAVLPDQAGMHMERDGNRRWLVVEQDPARLWPRVREFWTTNGFILKKDDPRIGIMETDWIENRADIPKDGIRAVLGKALDFAYSAPTRDRFRVRLEPGSGATEIYLTHYGVEEVGQGGVGQRQSETIKWQPRPADPELEAEMLRRLMIYLGASEKRAETQLAKAANPQTPKVRLQDAADGQKTLVIDENYARAWRLVGLALDGSNFVVEDQNRGQGLYVVEYNDPLVERKESKGLFSGLAFWRKDSPSPPGMRYRVRLAGQGSQTLVVVQNAQGQPDNSPTAQLILKSLLDVIK